jgi:hypothetical protein
MRMGVARIIITNRQPFPRGQPGEGPAWCPHGDSSRGCRSCPRTRNRR